MNYEIYCDGATSNNGRSDAIGGWAYVVLEVNGTTRTEIHRDSGRVDNATNQQMELTAAIRACNKLCAISKNFMQVVIYSDSAYLVNCYNQHWWKAWILNGWINSQKQPVKNKELWEQLIPYFKQSPRFIFVKVKGHSNNKFNNMVDEMAVAARTSKAQTDENSRNAKIVIVNGTPGAGKTTFEKQFLEYALSKNKKTLILSTVDFVKQIAQECGWNGKKTDRNRKFLSDLKDLLTEWDDVPYKKICEQVRNARKEYDFIFIDCREPNEIKRLVDELGAKAVIVRRLADEYGTFSNHADANVFNYEYDYSIPNFGTLDDLLTNVVLFYNKLEEGEQK